MFRLMLANGRKMLIWRVYDQGRRKRTKRRRRRVDSDFLWAFFTFFYGFWVDGIDNVIVTFILDLLPASTGFSIWFFLFSMEMKVLSPSP